MQQYRNCSKIAITIPQAAGTHFSSSTISFRMSMRPLPKQRICRVYCGWMCAKVEEITWAQRLTCVRPVAAQYLAARIRPIVSKFAPSYFYTAPTARRTMTMLYLFSVPPESYAADRNREKMRRPSWLWSGDPSSYPSKGKQHSQVVFQWIYRLFKAITIKCGRFNF